jgi:hypothetical protein
MKRRAEVNEEENPAKRRNVETVAQSPYEGEVLAALECLPKDALWRVFQRCHHLYVAWANSRVEGRSVISTSLTNSYSV